MSCLTAASLAVRSEAEDRWRGSDKRRSGDAWTEEAKR